MRGMRSRCLLAASALTVGGVSFLAQMPSASADSLTNDTFLTTIQFADTTVGQCLTVIYAAHGTPSGKQVLAVDADTSGVQGTGDFVTTTDADCVVSALSVNATYIDPDGVRRTSGGQAFAGNAVNLVVDGVPGSATLLTSVKFTVSYLGPNSHTTVTSPK